MSFAKCVYDEYSFLTSSEGFKITRKNDFAEGFKILLDTDLKMILLES